ncbi:MAG: hypothetical protein HZA93_22255, partial [Verrucomicrobia bacterium]|nr:hypothetical protein [Verrucomicrobiota bacterium]
DIDFFRDVPSRNLKGLSTRSDGRLVAGPTFSELAVRAPADLLWCLVPGADPTRWLIGTGPEGKIVEVMFDPANATYAARDVAILDDPQVFTLLRLPDGAILAGTAPRGGLYLIRDDKPVARAGLPADSIIDLALLDAATALAGTGNPGRIYRIDLQKFAAAGVSAEKITDARLLADRGIAVFGEIRDRNVRRLAVLPGAQGRVIAGSSPKGNVYAFPRAGGAPVILQENTAAEVTDLLVQPDGDFYATVAYSAGAGDSRQAASAAKPSDNKPAGDLPPAAQPEKFGGRSTLVWFPANGFPETLLNRTGTAFYHLARHAELLLISGGETGDMLGYNLRTRNSFTYAGSSSAQLNGIAPLTTAPGKFILIRNNVPGLALLDFTTTARREAETRRLDLTLFAQFGALRFNRQRNLDDAQLSIEMKTSNGSDEIEGWTPWTPLSTTGDGWRAPAAGLRGRYFKLRLKLAETAPVTTELDKAAYFVLPQNRRPTLGDFRVLTPNYGIIAAVEQPPPATVTYGQVINAGPPDPEGKRKATLNNSQIVPAPGTQVIFWNVSDPDGDNVACTLSIRRDGDANWIDVATNNQSGFASFETGELPDGLYFTRLVATELAPRPAAERLTVTFETDDLLVDHAKPEFVSATARREGDNVVIAIRGRDALSMLQGIEVLFNSGVREVLEHPEDGVRDGREETFVLDVPIARVATATSVEVILYDVAGNGISRRLTW